MVLRVTPIISPIACWLRRTTGWRGAGGYRRHDEQSRGQALARRQRDQFGQRAHRAARIAVGGAASARHSVGQCGGDLLEAALGDSEQHARLGAHRRDQARAAAEARGVPQHRARLAMADQHVAFAGGLAGDVHHAADDDDEPALLVTLGSAPTRRDSAAAAVRVSAGPRRVRRGSPRSHSASRSTLSAASRRKVM